MIDSNNIGNTITLRNYIANRKMYPNIKIHTFCHLMKEVSNKIFTSPKSVYVINLDDIKINIVTGEIVIEDYLVNHNDLEKTMILNNTGVSMMSERKSTKENAVVSFALMVLGWYVTPDERAIPNDMIVLENFDMYMSLVPRWLLGYFIEIFKNMNHNLTFEEYYDKHFTHTVRTGIDEVFREFDLNDNQKTKITKLIGKKSKQVAKQQLEAGNE